MLIAMTCCPLLQKTFLQLPFFFILFSENILTRIYLCSLLNQIVKLSQAAFKKIIETFLIYEYFVFFLLKGKIFFNDLISITEKWKKKKKFQFFQEICCAVKISC